MFCHEHVLLFFGIKDRTKALDLQYSSTSIFQVHSCPIKGEIPRCQLLMAFPLIVLSACGGHGQQHICLR